MGCLNAKYSDRCASFLLAKNYSPTWTKSFGEKIENQKVVTEAMLILEHPSMLT